jgi:hypothetical protein
LRFGGARPFVYLAYATDDSREAATLGRSIESAGWDVCFGRSGPPAALDASEHADLVRRAACVLILWSANAFRASYIKTDILLGIEIGACVVVRLDDSALPAVIPTAVNLQSWSIHEELGGTSRLRHEIERLAGRPPGKARGSNKPYAAAPRGGPGLAHVWALVAAGIVVAIGGAAVALDAAGLTSLTWWSAPPASERREVLKMRGFSAAETDGGAIERGARIDWFEQAAWREVEQQVDLPTQLDAIASFLVDFPNGALREDARLLESQQRDALREIQVELVARGFLAQAEGASVHHVRSAVENFERSIGLPSKGLISASLLAALRADIIEDGGVPRGE